MPNIISNASGSINITVAITQEMVADQYKLTYNCSNVGDGKSFLLITGDNTYFFPLQFTGQQEVLFNAEFGSLIQCVLHGNASINGLTLATNDTLSDDDRQAIDLVKTDSEYWQKIKDIVDENDKIRADKMAGILNMTLNSFANKNGTVTQKDGIYTWMNGSSYETATEAVRISGGAIGVSNKKDGNGDWEWKTAITGVGIKADAIVADSFDAVEIKGAKITAGSITGTDLKSATISGSTIISGTKGSGTYIELDELGNVHGYKNFVRVFNIDIYDKTYPEIKLGNNLNTGMSSDLTIGESYNSSTGQYEFNILTYGAPLNITGYGRISIATGGTLDITAKEIHLYGDVYDKNNVQRFTTTE